ncbi:MAG: hypothetical protein R2766_11910 [Saprospiraceae bacterium]
MNDWSSVVTQYLEGTNEGGEEKTILIITGITGGQNSNKEYGETFQVLTNII